MSFYTREKRFAIKRGPRPSGDVGQSPLAWSLVLIAAPLLAASAASWGGCTTTSGTGTSSGIVSTGAGGQGGGGGQGGEGPAAITGRDLFEALKPSVLEECGTCHKNGGISEAPFLGIEGYEYESITSWPGVVVAIPSQSIIVTHPADPSHGSGQAPDMSDELRAKVIEWLKLEAANIPEPEGGNIVIPPFKPILKGALNTIYLDPYEADLEYSSISFNAEELGDPPSMLRLTNVRVNPIAGVTIHIVHPLFTVYPPDGSQGPDPIDNFSMVDATFSLKSDAVALGTGAAVIANWTKDARLGMAFELIDGEVDMGGVVVCKSLDTFKNEVVPAMQYCAETCHGGKNVDANATMDLSKLNDPNPVEACAQVRARITPGDPANSQIVIVTDPTQQAVHMYKFKGNISNYNAFKNAVTPWIQAEQ
jgi:hypothetical protein